MAGVFTTDRPVPEQYEPLLLKPALDGLARGEQPAERGPDEFPIFADDPLAAAHRRVSRFIADAEGKFDVFKPREFKVRQVYGAAEMLDAGPEGRFDHVLAAVARELWYWKRAVKEVPDGWRFEFDARLFPLKPLVRALLRNVEGPVAYDAMLKLLDAVTLPRVGGEVLDYVPLTHLLPIVAATVARDGIDDAAHAALTKLRARCTATHYDWGKAARERKEMAQQIDEIIDPRSRKAAPPPIDPGEPWSDAALPRLTDPKWAALFAHAAAADGAQPSQKFRKTSTALVDAIGTDAFERTLVEWFDLMLKPRSAPLTEQQLHGAMMLGHRMEADLYSPRNETVLKGLAWIAGAVDRGGLAIGLGNLAERCYKKIPQIGPRSPKVGNACLAALAIMTGPRAAGQLSRLKSVVKQPTGRKMIERALSRLADRSGLTVDDLEEQNIPGFGLVDGATECKVGPAVLRVTVTRLGDVEQSWLAADGKVRKSVPADVKASHADELKALKRELAGLEKTLAAQRLRVERLFLRRTPWSIDAWRSAYHDHPLVRVLARRLIWSFKTPDANTSVSAAWDGKRFVGADDRPVAIDGKGMLVTLWHPSAATGDEVLAWRRWLDAHEVTQPFKQAHREIYLLTDAERATETYSNRFAQHVIRQHQFQALCQQRGWKYQLMGGFDFHNYPMLEIPLWNARVEFWVNVAEDTSVAGSGIAMHLTTDQVRFLNPATDRPVRLRDVPPLLMSEVFRDVDLFVGVASVGTDPTWQDGGPGGQYRDYWNDYSFGELSQPAATRREVLAKLLPRLTKLRDAWTLTERFLVIRGKLRTYKVHLGSGNILMEPNDQYLCIVADRTGGRADAGTVFLPFEGDGTLSVILSKAFLLADDANIKDPTITRQIGKK